MGTYQFELYNGALRVLKQERLATVTDSVPARYLLDDAYIRAKAHCLELAQWNFASVSTSLAGTVSSNRGFAYRFTKPADFVRPISISASSTYYPPIENYAEDATYWFANEATLYLTYVSSYSESTTVTMTIASPGVVTWTNHGKVAGDPIVFTTTGALPTGITAGTTYYVISTSITSTTFQFSATYGGSAVNTSGSQSGTHTGQGLSGGNLSKWPQSYAKVVEAYLAMEIAPHLTNADGITGRATSIFEDALAAARAKDGVNRTSRILTAATLSTYNGVLRLLGKRLLTNFDDRTIARRVYDANGEPATGQSQGRPGTLPANDIEAEMVLRRLIDESYDASVEYMLGQGLWNFAARTVAIESEIDVEPSFGFTYAFEKPTDYIRIVAIGDNGSLWPPLNDYLDEGNYWHANVDPLYIQYISDDASYGLNTGLWPQTFKKALEAYIALQIAPDPHANVSGTKLQMLQAHYKDMIRDARAKDAMNQGNQRPPPGRLAIARAGGRLRDSYRRET